MNKQKALNLDNYLEGLFYFLFLFVGIILFNSCKLADLRTSEVTADSVDREPKAIALLDSAIEAQRFDVLKNAETYSIKAKDNWRTLFAITNPLPRDNKWMLMRFRPISFDGQFEYLNVGDHTVHGVQSLSYYKIDKSGAIKFKKRKKIVFGLAAIQYFFELPLRLRNAPIIKYAGNKEVEGIDYHLIFVTWETVIPNKNFDQYLLYINKETNLLDFASYTIRDIYLPVPKSIYGSIRYSDKVENQEGIIYASALKIQFNKLKGKKRWIHKLNIDELKLNAFDKSSLYPNKDLKYIGDSKNQSVNK